MNFKKILVLLLLIAVTVGVGYGLYYMFFRAPTGPVTPPVNAPVNAAPGAGLPIAEPGVPLPIAPPAAELELPPGVDRVAQGGVTLTKPVVTVPTTGASLSASGQINYYDRLDGKFYRLQPDGTVTALSGKEFFNVSDATFNPQGDQAILEYPDGSNIYYDFTSGKQVTLPQHWEDFDFSGDGGKIIAKSLGIDRGSRFLVVSNPDGSNARAVQELGDNAAKVIVDWSPNNQIVAWSQTGTSTGSETKQIFAIGQNQENFKALYVEGLGFQPQWSPSGNQLLYSTSGSLSDYKPMLWVSDASGDDIGNNRRNLPINTWANKCAFASENEVYCAVPIELVTGAGLQPSLSDNTPDTIYRIDLATGLQETVAIPEGEHTVGRLMLSPDGRRLYFTDKASGVINQIDLAP